MKTIKEEQDEKRLLSQERHARGREISAKFYEELSNLIPELKECNPTSIVIDIRPDIVYLTTTRPIKCLDTTHIIKTTFSLEERK